MRLFLLSLFIILFSCTGKKESTDQKKELTTKEKVEIGLSIANKTQMQLAKNLVGTIQNSGTGAALEFCNEKAYPLTDEMANKLNASIKRVSNKPRNPDNKATEKEENLINHFQQLIDSNSEYTPFIGTLENGKTQFYAPIITNGLCLQCHGSATDIRNKTLNKIKNLYPNDMAKGYSVNEVRGLWRIEY